MLFSHPSLPDSSPDVRDGILQGFKWADLLFGFNFGRPKTGSGVGLGAIYLLWLGVAVLYRKGVWRGKKVFERNAQGKVVRLLDRRENNDLVWQKMK